MKSSPYRVAVIGLGYFSRFHLDAWLDIGRAMIVGLSDLDAAKTAQAARLTGAPGISDPAKMLEATDPDIVDIIAPPPAHDALVRAALAPGRVVICQKPFCTSIDEARELAKAAEAAGTVLLVHENFRFQPWHRAIKRFLDTGEMGQVFQVRFALRPGDGRGKDAYLDRQPAFREMPRLLIHETGVHFIDLFRWLLGDIEWVQADLRRLNPALKGEDAGVLTMAHGSGARSVFDGNRLSDHQTDNPRRTMGEMEIEGEAGSLRLDGAGRIAFRRFGSGGSVSIPVEEPVDDSAFGGGCVAALNRHVVAALDGEVAFENQASAYLPVISAVEAAYRSDAEGQRIVPDAI